MDRNAVRMGNGKEPEERNLVKRGMEYVWKLTVSAYSFTGNDHIEFRPQKNVVFIYRESP